MTNDPPLISHPINHAVDGVLAHHRMPVAALSGNQPFTLARDVVQLD